MLEILLALSPVLLVLFLLIVLKRSIIFSAGITLAYTILLAAMNWLMPGVFIAAALGKALLVAVDITIIIFGAIFFLEVLKRTKLVDEIESSLCKVSHDQRVQGIILAWFLVSFLEGTAGFGTPAAIVAPLLVAIGFPAVTAVSVALIADSSAVVFGAVGTPIRIGFAGLDTSGVAFTAAFLTMIVGLIVPVMLLYVIVKTSPKGGKGSFRELVPFALWAGVALLVPFFLFSFLGQEFPSLFGPLVGLAIIVFTTKRGFLLPKNVWKFDESRLPKTKGSGSIKPFIPYILLLVFLFGGKYVLPKFNLVLIAPIMHILNLYNPGLLFVAAILIFMLFKKPKEGVLKDSVYSAVKILYKPFLAVLFITGFVQVMVHSGLNYSGLGSMISVVASSLETRFLPLFSPFIGGFGAFVAGSATVSNLLFGQFQFAAAVNLGISTALILALQVIGAGAGNMISLTNIVAAQATVKLSGKEAEVLRNTFVPFLIYVVLVGVLGFVVSLII